MLKAAGAVLVIFACAALGYSKSMELSKRLHCLTEIQKMVILLLGEITYRKEALPQAMNRVAEKMKEPFSSFLKDVSWTAQKYQGERFSQIFAQKTEEYLRNSEMTKKDREEFAQLGEYLGYMDITMQKNTTALYLEELKNEIRGISEEIPVKQKLYQSMGVMGGFFLAIILL